MRSGGPDGKLTTAPSTSPENVFLTADGKRAEVATGVLHNVGNVLNSVNISASVVCDQLKNSRADDLKRTTDRLAAHRDRLAEFLAADGRATKLLDYLSTLNEKLESERAGLVRELELLTQKVEHIKSVIAAQQGYARRVTYREELQVEREIRGKLIQLRRGMFLVADQPAQGDMGTAQPELNVQTTPRTEGTVKGPGAPDTSGRAGQED